MDQEQTTPESPLEKAKRLLAEKESKDKERIEAETQKELENQAKEQKLEELNSLKQELERQLDEINSKVEASRNEAHETRDTLRGGGLDQNLDYKEEYNGIISEVADNLNNLRQEKNRIKAELEMVNLNIENFDINENIAEAKKDVQAETATVEQENVEAINQVKDYPGSDAQNLEAAQEVINESSQEIDQITENSDQAVENIITEDVVGEQKIEKYEGPLGELELQYRDIKDKIGPKKDQYEELTKQMSKLLIEENSANAQGDKERALELKEAMATISEKKEKIYLGEKKFEQLKQHQNKFKELDGQLTAVLVEIRALKESKEQGEISAEQYQNQTEPLIAKQNDLYEQITKNNNEADKIKNDKEFGKEEESLEYLYSQEEQLINAAKKELGYDESVQKIATEKLGPLGSYDAHRLMLNNYLGLNLPVFSQDFEIRNLNKKGWGNSTHEVIDDNSPEGNKNRDMLGAKQESIYNDFLEKAKKLAGLPEESKKKLIKLVKEDNSLLTEALSTEHTDSFDMADIDGAIDHAFNAYSNSDKQCRPLSVKNQEARVGDQMVDQAVLRNSAHHYSKKMMFTFTSFKIAKDNGLIE